ncbi:unnamed protein product [Ambrosiozyma monospora]|uniref:Unnamed protein product n=1 Tax=Ambrosiozyma monospora TaxID=43982 RepID=A0ACB5STC3_AMBMO|nr:unnamed protein product [Ambrosiozyma monospora]
MSMDSNESYTSSTRVRRHLSHVSKVLSHLSGAEQSVAAGAAASSIRGSMDIPLERPPTLANQLIREYSRVEPYNQNTSTNVNIITETNLSSKDVTESGKNISFVNKYHLNYVVFFLKNFKKPNSVALVISLTIALIPWLKALFVNTGSKHVHDAPDNLPPLSFIMDYFSYCAQPAVPLGLILIGSLLGRMEISSIPPGFWKSVLCNTVYRLGILPIIGVAWTTKLKNIGWLTDPMSFFVTCMEFALPSATVQIYLTAGCADPEDDDCTPMNCLGLYIIAEYVVLVVSMPIVVCYAVKNVMEL